MDAYATITFLHNTTGNGRRVRRVLVELISFNGQWLGSFVAFGFTAQACRDRAYVEADLNLSCKGFRLQYITGAA